MSNKLLSIIVPVYKTEKYLVKCVESIRNQTYKNLEIILVDDGSPDNCGEICDNFQLVDDRIQVIHKSNGGLSSARNAGLKIASGDYVTFVDSDDYVEIDIYEKLINILETNQCDIVTMQFREVNGDYVSVDCMEIPEGYLGIHNGGWYLQRMCERKISESVCSKIFKKECLINQKFDETKLNEDFLFLSKLSLSNIKIFVTNYVGYNYLQNNGSISRSGFGKSIRDAVYNTCEIKEMIESSNKKNLLPYIGAYSAYQASRAVITMSMSQYYQNIEFAHFCKRVIKGNKQYLKESIFAKKDRIFCRLYMYFPQATKRLAEIIFRGKR